jgi:hypothetical protein
MQYGIGPRRPMPFPDGKRVHLVMCPKCKAKGMLMYMAPYERGYKTMCVKCRQFLVVKAKDRSFRDIQNSGGFTPLAPGIRKDYKWGLDATKFFEEKREMHDIGFTRAYKQGYIPAPIDAALR